MASFWGLTYLHCGLSFPVGNVSGDVQHPERDRLQPEGRQEPEQAAPQCGLREQPWTAFPVSHASCFRQAPAWKKVPFALENRGV